eukprot:CAMPEP_0119071720 /NCGR_PEP_ID=MMETSP1178-20130426/53602_1 /TAXON_ID=33656 /ORGANISM="unid sp, Strain CCMP2000" /LENGTH=155 /DNA_ID=CAMNT_0007053675 /DNA_START=1 /DNA_END=468 /DNA_ORIENTATION=+
MSSSLLVLALLPSTAAWSATIGGAAVSQHMTPRSPFARRCAAIFCKEEYTRKAQMLVESRDPFRQARLFFFYPATIAGTSVAAWVSVTRLIAGLGGFRSDTVPTTDALNLAVNLGILAAAVYFGRGDLRSRTADLESESGRSKAPAPDADTETED